MSTISHTLCNIEQHTQFNSTHTLLKKKNNYHHLELNHSIMPKLHFPKLSHFIHFITSQTFVLQISLLHKPYYDTIRLY